MKLVVINRDKNDAVAAQQVTCQRQTREHHGQPRRMLTPTGLNPAGRGVAEFINLAGLLKVLTLRHREVIVIGEFVARVVRRVDVDPLDRARVAVLQKLEHL